MALSHEHVGIKILAKIRIYILSRAKLLCSVCHEIPCIRHTMHKKGLKFAPLSEAKFYLYHSTTKIAKARPGFDDRPEYPSVQMNSSSP